MHVLLKILLNVITNFFSSNFRLEFQKARFHGHEKTPYIYAYVYVYVYVK